MLIKIPAAIEFTDLAFGIGGGRGHPDEAVRYTAPCPEDPYHIFAVDALEFVIMRTPEAEWLWVWEASPLVIEGGYVFTRDDRTIVIRESGQSSFGSAQTFVSTVTRRNRLCQRRRARRKKK